MTTYNSTHKLLNKQGETLVNNVYRRLQKLGYKYDGGYSSLDRGWSRLCLNLKICQSTWFINNDGELNIAITFTKFAQ